MSIALTTATPDYLNAPTIPVSDKPVSVAGWFWATSDAAAQNIFSITDTAGNVHYMSVQLRTAPNIIRLRLRDGGTTTSHDTTNTWVTNAWHHFCISWSINYVRVWLDGNVAGKYDQNVGRVFSSENDTTRIGTGNGTVPGSSIDGFMAEVGVWSGVGGNRIHDDNEAVSLAAGAYPPSIRSGDMVMYMPLRNNKVDIAGHRAFTTVGTPTFSTNHPRIYRSVSPHIMTPGLGVGGIVDRDADPFYPFGVGPQFDGAEYPPFYRLCG